MSNSALSSPIPTGNLVSRSLESLFWDLSSQPQKTETILKELFIHCPSHLRISHFPKISEDDRKSLQVLLDLYFSTSIFEREIEFDIVSSSFCAVQRTKSWDIVFLIFRLLSWVENQGHIWSPFSPQKLGQECLMLQIPYQFWSSNFKTLFCSQN